MPPSSADEGRRIETDVIDCFEQDLDSVVYIASSPSPTATNNSPSCNPAVTQKTINSTGSSSFNLTPCLGCCPVTILFGWVCAAAVITPIANRDIIDAIPTALLFSASPYCRPNKYEVYTSIPREPFRGGAVCFDKAMACAVTAEFIEDMLKTPVKGEYELKVMLQTS
jgi:hypothetical protein